MTIKKRLEDRNGSKVWPKCLYEIKREPPPPIEREPPPPIERNRNIKKALHDSQKKYRTVFIPCDKHICKL